MCLSVPEIYRAVGMTRCWLRPDRRGPAATPECAPVRNPRLTHMTHTYMCASESRSSRPLLAGAALNAMSICGVPSDGGEQLLEITRNVGDFICVPGLAIRCVCVHMCWSSRQGSLVSPAAPGTACGAVLERCGLLISTSEWRGLRAACATPSTASVRAIARSAAVSHANTFFHDIDNFLREHPMFKARVARASAFPQLLMPERGLLADGRVHLPPAARSHAGSHALPLAVGGRRRVNARARGGAATRLHDLRLCAFVQSSSRRARTGTTRGIRSTLSFPAVSSSHHPVSARR